ncbi:MULTISPECIES: LuxR C-terminal-related transcriptional regulator [unclassified Sphingomonas]|uniref:LuxR C-terminal-related transcriptional regulator n=1 Tax=unclassified Sphingomonas TaxID=196159 RepID=UPI001D10757D|nr:MULTISPECIES: response regulator transcription factor [unclassified Sphingomonas]MCC2981314.1 response regulator transcription factor [Sphingomonas sp. IC4-52]MCD2317026.1 response regulator transcription factor [Sphingomonas sp. IC-11]
MALGDTVNDVFIVSPNEIIREGLRRILVDQGFNVVNAVPSAVTWSSTWSPNLTIVDAQEFDSGLATCQMIRNACTTTRIVLMMDEYRADYVATAFASGAIDGFLVKAIACEPLAGALRLIAMGERLLPSQAISAFTERSLQPAVGSYGSLDGANLSSRELEILACLIQGDANKVISRRLQISDATVKVHIKAILRKLRVSNRTQAAIWAVSRGVTLDKAEVLPGFARPVHETSEALLQAQPH